MKKFYYHFFFFIIYFNLPLLSNGNLIDSLKNELKKNENDSLKVLILNKLSYALEATDPNLGIVYGKKGVELARQINWKKGEADCLLYIGRNYFALKKIEDARNYYNLSLNIYKNLRNYKDISYNYEYFANSYSYQSNYKQLLVYLYKILEINKKINNKWQVAEQYNNIGLVNYYLSNYDKSLASFNESMFLNKKLKDSLGMAFNLVNSGRVYKELNDYDKALDNYFEGLKIFKLKHDIYNTSRTYYFIAEVLYLKNDYNQSNNYVDKAINEIPNDSVAKKYQIKEYTRSLLLKSKLLKNQLRYLDAIDFADEALSYSKLISYKDGIAMSLSSLGRLYYLLSEDSLRSQILRMDNKQKLQNSRFYLEKSISLLLDAEKLFGEIGELDERSKNLKHLSFAYKANKNINLAYRYYVFYTKLKDSVFNKENIKNIGKLESDFEYKLKLSDSENEKIIAQKNASLIRNRNIILILILSIVILITIAIIWLYFKRKKYIRELEERKLQIESQNLELENKKEQLLKLNIAKDKIFGTISHDLRNSLKGFVIGTENLRKQGSNTDIDYLNNSAISMNQLLESLLLYADNNFQNQKIEYKTINLSDIINEVLILYTKEIISKELKIRNELAESTVLSDISYCTIILRNIIHNAIKFSNRNGIIEITSFAEDNFTIVMIKDYGCGISELDIDKLENYEQPQIKNPIGNFNSGNGLGLITAKEFIEKVNGFLHVESKVQEYTKIHLYFPTN